MKICMVLLLVCCVLAGRCGTAAAESKRLIYGYDDYKDLMWQVIGEEPCLRTLIERHDVARAELIFLMHWQHLYHFPLKYFCAPGVVDPVLSENDIALLFDAHTHHERLKQHVAGDGGIGIDLFEDNGNIVVSEIGEGSPAFHSGIQRYDTIISVDGVSVHDIFKVPQLIWGKPGSTVRLVLQRGNHILQKVIVREKKEYSDIAAMFIPSRQIGYLRISEFPHHGEVAYSAHQLLDIFQMAHARSIVLDLRGNAGGSVYAARLILGYFLGKATAYLETNPAREEFMLPVETFIPSLSDEWLLHVPIMVLVDRYSYSAAEMVASSLDLHHRALIMGERTGGKGTIQRGITLHNGRSLFITMGEWDMINGKTVEKTGMEPQVTFESLRDDAPLSDNGDMPYFYAQDQDLVNAISFFEKKLLDQ